VNPSSINFSTPSNITNSSDVGYDAISMSSRRQTKKRSTQGSYSINTSRKGLLVGLKISQDQKFEIINEALSELKEKIKKTSNNFEAEISDLNARILQFRSNIEDYETLNKKLKTYESKKSCTEFSTFLKIQIKSLDYLCAKLKRKNSILKAKSLNFYSQIKQRRSIGESVQWIDFQKLQIENKKSIAKLERTNKKLMDGKLKDNIQKRVFSSKQHDLTKTETVLRGLRSKIEKKRDQTHLMKTALANIKSEINSMENKVSEFSEKISNYSAPSIKSYIQLVSENDQLKNKMKSFERKQKLIN